MAAAPAPPRLRLRPTPRVQGGGGPPAGPGHGGCALRAPMPGMIISYSVHVGDKVAIGGPGLRSGGHEKIQNPCRPQPGRDDHKAINFDPGASVAKDTVILVIGKNREERGKGRPPLPAFRGGRDGQGIVGETIKGTHVKEIIPAPEDAPGPGHAAAGILSAGDPPRDRHSQ